MAHRLCRKQKSADSFIPCDKHRVNDFYGVWVYHHLFLSAKFSARDSACDFQCAFLDNEGLPNIVYT